MFLGKLFTPLLDSLSGSLFDWWSSAGHELPQTEAIAPEDIFEAGDIGYVFDPSDYSTMFQDSAGTIPVTALYQPVGRVNDKNGSALFAVQATTPARPELRLELGIPSLYTDGIDDRVNGTFISATGIPDITVCVSGIETGGRTVTRGQRAHFSVFCSTPFASVSSYGWGDDVNYYGYGAFSAVDDYAYARIVDIPATDSEPLTVITRAVAGVEFDSRSYQSDWAIPVAPADIFDGFPAGDVVFGVGFAGSGHPASLFGGFFIDRKITAQEAESILEYYKQKVV